MAKMFCASAHFRHVVRAPRFRRAYGLHADPACAAWFDCVECGGCVRIDIMMVLHESIPFRRVLYNLNALCVHLGVTSSRGCGKNKDSSVTAQGGTNNGRYSK